MSWPPSEQEWAEILNDVPTDQHAKVRTFVDARVQEYWQGETQHRLWNAIATQARTKLMQGFCQNVEKLRVYLPDPESEWVLHLAAELASVAARAKARAEVYSKNNRKQRLYAGILRAWTDTDERRRLGASEVGPAQRLLCAIVERLGIQLSERGAKQAIRREQDRRETLFVRKENWSATGSLSDDLVLRKRDASES